jgi:hypothetical protein
VAEDDGMIFLRVLQEKLDDHDFIHAMMVARLIWLRRNSFVFDGFFTPPAILVQQALSLREEFVKAKGQMLKASIAPNPGVIRWSKPPMGSIKFNWDASLDHIGKRMGVG